MIGKKGFVVIYFIIGMVAHPLSKTAFDGGKSIEPFPSLYTPVFEDPCSGSSSTSLSDHDNYKSQNAKHLEEPYSKLDIRSTKSPSNLSDPVTIFYRVPESRVCLKITTRPTVLSGTNMHISLTNARNYVLTAIHHQRGNEPITKGEFIYPPNITGIGIIFVAFRFRLTWNEVDSALIGLVAALWGQGYYTEAKFMIYKWNDERDIEEQGSGTIYTTKRP